MADTPSAVPMPTIRPSPPPAEVTAQLHALKAVCANWSPVAAVNNVQSADDTEEAYACSVSPNNGAELFGALYLGIGAGVMLAILGWLLIRFVWEVVSEVRDAVIAWRRREAA